MKKKFYCLCMGMLLGISSVEAKVTLPSIISDNMVLQAQTKVCIWGKATPGENISVAPSWNEKSISTTAGKDGRWRVYISTPKASDNHSLTVKGENVITIRNVLIGEVWLCTGQSNMEFPVAHDPKVKWKTGMLGEAEVMKDADYPEIRLFHVEHQLAHEKEQDDCTGKWVVCSPENIRDFSAVGFVFGNNITKLKFTYLCY